jgi:phosphoglycolate phosphatase
VRRALEHGHRAHDARRFDLLIFDWDGTLADSTSIIAEALAARLSRRGMRVPDDVAARYVIGLGLADASSTSRPSFPPPTIHGVRALPRPLPAREAEIPLFDGARELLVELRQAGYRLAVATGKTRVGLDRALTAPRRSRRCSTRRVVPDEGAPSRIPTCCTI